LLTSKVKGDSFVQPMMPQQQKEDPVKKEKALREEREKRLLEIQIREFDANAFYESLLRWMDTPLPQPIVKAVRVTPLRQKTMIHQPLPISRKGLNDLRKISANTARLISLLHAIEVKGVECPYIHQQYRRHLEQAIQRCRQLQEARVRYKQGKGFWMLLRRLLNKLHLDSVQHDVSFFQRRLEALLLFCRHQEFAHDLQHLNRMYSSRSNATVKAEKSAGESKGAKKSSKKRRGFFSFQSSN